MHLGRFHAVVSDLAVHFKSADLPAKLEASAVALDSYVSTRGANHIEVYRTALAAAREAAQVSDLDLLQPYASQVVSHLAGVSDCLGSRLIERIDAAVTGNGMDHSAVAAALRGLAAEVAKVSQSLANIDSAFEVREVEWERVADGEAEIGLLLPRAAVGSRLDELASEFSRISKLARAINELTGAEDYDPLVRTVASSDWQLFLDLDPAQILVWVVTIERIIALFKSNLEIKVLQQQLKSKQLEKDIIDLIEAAIEKRLTTGISDLAKEIRTEHGKVADEGRANELETQLRHGLTHLAKRINQGAQVDINVSLPRAPKEPTADAEGNVDPVLQEQIEAQKAFIAKLRDLRSRGRAASIETMRLDKDELLLLKYFEPQSDKQGEGN